MLLMGTLLPSLPNITTLILGGGPAEGPTAGSMTSSSFPYLPYTLRHLSIHERIHYDLAELCRYLVGETCQLDTLHLDLDAMSANRAAVTGIRSRLTEACKESDVTLEGNAMQVLDAAVEALAFQLANASMSFP